MKKASWPIKKLGEMKLPEVRRDGALINRLIPILLGGFDEVLDKKSQLYMRLLCRLVDKVFDEYVSAHECLIDEIQSGNKLAYRFKIINHFENCINALNRASAIFQISKRRDLGGLVSKLTKKKLERLSVSEFRNSVEHIDKDINREVWQKDLFLDVDENYENICINSYCISFKELVDIINQYHDYVLEIFSNMPNRRKDEIFYYDKQQ